jgi:hypothetical protein
MSDVLRHEIEYTPGQALSWQRPLRSWLLTPVLAAGAALIALFPTWMILLPANMLFGRLSALLVIVTWAVIAAALFGVIWYQEGVSVLMLNKALKDRGVLRQHLKLVVEDKWQEWVSNL